MEKRLKKMLIPLLFLLLLILVFNIDYFNKYSNYGKLIINEVMSKNTYTIVSDRGDYSDFIELYNGYDYDIDLDGYYLSDDDNHYKWEFDDAVIGSKSYLVVYASGLNSCNDNVCHTNFKLSDKGESITLSNQNGSVISRIKYEQMINDTSYGYKDGEYVYFYKGTPGSENIGNSSLSVINREESNVSLRINEYMNNNEATNYDEDMDSGNWVEIYNYGESDIDLLGYSISDEETNINKYVLPSVIIKKGEYLSIYLDGKDKVDKYIHTSFSLTDKDSVLVLSDNKGNLVDKLYLDSLPKNVSSGYSDERIVYYTNSTMGRVNSDKYYDDVYRITNKDKDLLITEVSSVYKEGIEIKNISDKNINLNGYKIGDKSGSVKSIGNVTVKSNGYYVYYGLNLNNSDEIVYLYDKDGYVIDSFKCGKMTNNTSYGLNSDGDIVVYGKITLGYDNDKTYYQGYSPMVNFSIQGGYVSKGTKIELSTSDGSEIYYTLDGSFPTAKSNKYTEPIIINKTTVVKAISIKDNNYMSDYYSRTYFVTDKHGIAVVSLSTDKGNLFGGSGIYTNYRWDQERKISFEFYENDGTFGTSFVGGTKLVGQDSRNFPQKSMAIYLRKEYGQQEVTYPFFEDNITTFSSFTLRNSGEDVIDMKMKDAFLVATIKGQMDVDYQDYRPVAVYINGEYWGFYFIREKINESYIYNHYGIEEDNVDLIKGINDVRAGTINNYNQLVNYMKTHNMSDPKVYDYLETQIDMKSLAEYWIFQTYYNNTDTGNIRFYRARDGSSKWRWVLFDLDWCMYPSTYRWVDFNYPTLPYGHGYGNYFPTTITYSLWKNSEFRDLYLSTFAYHLKNTFYPERVHKILDEVSGMVREEMPRQIDRWYLEFKDNGYNSVSSISAWDSKLNQMKNMLSNRYDIVIKNLKSQFNLSNVEYEKYFGDL